MGKTSKTKKYKTNPKVREIKMRPVLSNRIRNYQDLLNGMDLNELISTAIELDKRLYSGKAPTNISSSAQKYIEFVYLCEHDEKKREIAKFMRQRLNEKIVTLNQKTSDIEKGKQLCQKLMDEPIGAGH